jgi:hypothetical protein
MSRRLPVAPAPGPLEAYAGAFDDLLGHRSQRVQFRRYLEGLLLASERNKTFTGLANTEPGAGATDPAAQRMQWFVSESTWDAERINQRRLQLLAATPATADERVYYPIEVEPYTPASHFARGKADPAFRTKPQIALQLVEQAVGAARPFRAVVADSFYGEHEAFKAGLETLSIGYVLALKPSHCWWHLEGTIGSVFDAAQAADWQADAPGDWVALQRVFRDGHEETWWALEADAGPYGPERAQRLVIVTTDPTQLPDQSTWYLTTNVPTPDSARAATRPLTAADLAEVVRLYGLRIWVEQSYKQVKGTLGWADYQVRNAVGIRRHWQLVWCAFSFCWWALDQEDIQPIESVLDTGLSPIQVEAVRAPHLSSANANQREKKTMRWRPRLRWPQALRKVRAWLEPYLKLRLYWQAGSKDPPPAPLQALLDRLEKGQPIYLYCR